MGAGFLEKVYENSLVFEVRRAGLAVAQQSPITIYYYDVIVGEYIGDLIVENMLLVELKAVRAIDDIHMAQCLNYLMATGLPMCLLKNFANPRVEIKRIVHNF